MRFELTIDLEIAILREGLFLKTPPGSPMHHAAPPAFMQSGPSTVKSQYQYRDESALTYEFSTSRLTVYRERTSFNQFIPELLSLGQTHIFGVAFIPANSLLQANSVSSPLHGCSAAIHPAR